MPNTWGRPPRNDIRRDLQALALWILIIGVVGYILFPDFFKGIYTSLSNPVAQTSALNDNYSLNNSTNTATGTAGTTDPQALLGQDLSSVSNALYNNGKNEVSSGDWVIFVANGEFQQFAVSSDTYNFLLKLIESDQNTTGKSTIILVENGQIKKFMVSDEINTIINNMALIMGRLNK